MRRFLQMLAVALCFGAVGAKAADSLTKADFAHSIKLSVDGYTGSETLVNFPVLVRVSEGSIDGFRYDEMSATNKNGVALGFDLAFFAEDGTRLASTNDTWNASGESLAWVRLPSMTQGTKFYMCYNVADGVRVDNPNPFTDYTGVWHMNDEGGKNKPISDSSTNELNGVTASTGNPSSVSVGKVGKARHIATDNNNNPPKDSGITISLPEGSAKRQVVDDLGSEFTASMWVRVTADFNYFYLFSRKYKDAYPAWGFQTKNDTSGTLRMWTGASGETENNVAMPVLDVALAAKNEWHKLDVIYKSDGTYEIYQDGGNKVSGALYNNTPALQGSLAGLSIGGGFASSEKVKGCRGLNGDMDEVRLRKGVLSADWVKADYDTVNDPNFIAVALSDSLTIAWVDSVAGAQGVEGTTYNSVVFAGTVQDLGAAGACAIKYKVWAEGASEPGVWTTLTNGLVVADTFAVAVRGLEGSTTYNYRIRASSDEGAGVPVSGTFMTDNGLSVDWSAASGVTGFSHIVYDYAAVGGTIKGLGAASSCIVQAKVWEVGEDEPSVWKTLTGNLASRDSFTGNVTGLDAGTTYNYMLRVLGTDDSEAGAVAGTFTTLGEAGETIGTPGETFFFNDGTNAYWVAEEFERYLPFTVTGYKGTETLTNFPVLVDVRARDENGFSYDDFYHIGGKDMVFVDERGHIIPHEIDTWNANGQSLIWVRLPEMNNGTTFTMCYRSPLVNPPSDPGNVFERYVGVWHMNEKGDGVVDVIDSTTNNLTGETHAQSLAYSSGRIGGARRVAQQAGTSSSLGRIIVFDKNDILRTGVGNVFTYSCWSKLADSKPGWAYIVSRKREDADKGWGIQYETGDLESTLRAWGGSTAKNKAMQFAVTGYHHEEWAYWTFVYSNDTFHAYLYGVELPSTVGGKKIICPADHTLYPVANDETASYANLVIGGQQIGTGALNGWVDECRYSKGMRSADWIKAEYDSTMQQAYWNDPTNRFVTKGDKVGRGPESLVPVVVWEQGENLPITVIDVSYAYVQFAGTVTFCGSGANTCFIEYQLWADGEVTPTEWTTLLDNAVPGDVFSIPVCGLKQDMPYNFRIRAVNEVDGVRRMTHEHTGSFRTNGNVNEEGDDGDLLRVDNRFVHRYPAGQYTFTTPDYVTNIEILVVGGGGAGGYRIGGGGGGGGVFHSMSYPVTTSTTYRVTVGRGGEAVTDVTTASSEGNGEYSFFALDSDPSHPLIEVPGGGGGGSFGTAVVEGKAVADGGDGASGGGGGGYGTQSKTGAPGGSAVEGFGHVGGNGNHAQDGVAGGGAYAGGGGGGGGRAGVDASSDSWYGGGAGGVGVGCNVLGEMLFFGAGGGGGYAYRTGKDSEFSKPGAGGDGIGGDAADVRNKTLATSGVPNTGAGGGGGSMTRIDNSSDTTYWQGGHGGDGVVIIAYEVHGRDPIAEEPRISMTRCEYDKDAVKASIDYRLYWAGMQNDFDDIYVHYSTVGPEELTNSAAGGWAKVAESALGVGTVEFRPPEVGHTYWVRIVARKNAGSFYFSDEFASFDVPAIALKGAIWTESKTSPDEDYATVTYKLYDTSETTHLYSYWSEDRSVLDTDEPPVGEGIFLMDLGANTESNLSSSTTFRIPATEGLIRNRTYYIRLAAGDSQGIKFFPSDEIVDLDTAEKPVSILVGASWADSNVATVEFTATVGKLDPAQTELVALYSTVESDVSGDAPETNETVTVVGLGLCSDFALDAVQSTASFPLWSDTITNYHVRLALATNCVSVVGGVATTNRVILGGSHSPEIASISVFHAVEAHTLLYIVTANPKIMCYGDDPLALDYTLEYAGQTEGWGWDNKYDLNGGSLACGVTSTTPSGNYAIEQGTLAIINGGQGQKNTEDGVETTYQYKLTFSGATYMITNAVFKTSISDVVTNYTGDAYDPSGLYKTLSNVRNDQPVTYRYRVGGAGEWGELPAFTNVGNYAVQFIASAPSHDDVRGTFKVTVVPAPLSATIGDVELDYTGDDMTPDVVTNVTGLVRSDINPLACEFRDESGEWQSTVPQFKSPGTYKLFFRVSAPNHESYTTNCTITVKGWDYKVNMDGMTGYATPINVSDPGWLIQHSEHTGAQLADPETRYADLDKVCGNGLKYWQNYVIGRTNLNQKLIATIMQSDRRVNENCFIVRFSAVQALRNTGLDVKFRLDTKLRGESEFTLGALSEKYEMNVPLGPDDPTGLYVFNVVLTPTNSDYVGCSVLSSVTTVGVIRVMSPVRNTVTAVPWGSMTFGTETNAAVMVANVLNPNGLSADDQLLAYDVQTRSFRGWKHVSGNDWDSIASVTKGGVFESSANEMRFNQGEAFWLSRSNPIKEDGSPVPYYLIGRYTGRDYLVDIAEGATNAPASSVCANPTMFDIDLNALVFEDNSGNPATPSFDDRIVTQTTNGTQAIYFRSKVSGKWGRNVIQKVNGRNKNVFVEGGNIPSGTGFWFQRKADGKLRIRFRSPERRME